LIIICEETSFILVVK